MRDNSSRKSLQRLANFGRVPGTAASIAFQCWWSSLNHLFFQTFQRVDSAQVLPCILCRFVLQLFSWTHTYPFGLRGDFGTPNPLWVGVECEKSQWSPSDLGMWNQKSHHCIINVHHINGNKQWIPIFPISMFYPLIHHVCVLTFIFSWMCEFFFFLNYEMMSA